MPLGIHLGVIQNLLGNNWDATWNPLRNHWDVIGKQKRVLSEIRIQINANINIILRRVLIPIRLPIYILMRCDWDAIGKLLGRLWDATGIQRRVLSNLCINIDMNINMNLNRNTHPTINIHISGMPSGCHWDVIGNPLGCRWGAKASTLLQAYEYSYEYLCQY